MDSDLSLEFLRVVEQAAIACAHTMGQGDRHKSDQVAVEAMRKVMDTVPIDGTIVIGEGERDEAPMLYIGEKVGLVHAKNLAGPRPVRFALIMPTFSPMYSIGASSRSPSPMTIVPSIGTVSITFRIASTATWSDLWRSPCPIVCAQAMAACSTTRRKSSDRSESR